MRKKTFWLSLFSGVVLGGLVLKFSQNPKAAAPKAKLELTDTPVSAEVRYQDLPENSKTIVAASAETAQESQQNNLDSNALSGKGLIAAGETETKIYCEGLSPLAQVYLTSDQEKKNLVLFVKRKVPFNPETGDCSHFLAAIPRPLDYDLNFQWWVVE
ncbi:hypothetical protein KKD61_03750 [Patescibacteria group bacterium]|nr:hypothetical protein [Patescibacteria group bacterium]